MNRRNLVKNSVVAGFALPAFLNGQVSADAKCKSVINIFLPGGNSHQEFLDPKPESPAEYRGPFTGIKTNVDGIRIGEQFKELATLADRLCIIRSMTHNQSAHARGTESMFTGYTPSPSLSYPSIGSVIAHEQGGSKMPPYICIPDKPNEFAGAGYLPLAFGPFGLGSDPASSSFKVRDITLSISDERYKSRLSLLEAIDSKFVSESENSKEVTAMQGFYDKAQELIGSPESRAAFDITKESDKTKEHYGTGQAGMRMLMARRLVEGGAKFINLTYGGWDNHTGLMASYNRQGPELDQALSALIIDLEDRGLLDSTMIVVNSEFGRTPKINASGDGRDHWSSVFSAMLVGGGVQGGQVYGSSDRLAAEVDEKPVSPGDLAATVYSAIGVDFKKRLMADGNRPIDIVRDGKPLEIF